MIFHSTPRLVRFLCPRFLRCAPLKNRFRSVATAALVVGVSSLSTTVDADVYITAEETAGGVVFQYSGAIDTTGFTDYEARGGTAGFASIDSRDGTFGRIDTGELDAYIGVIPDFSFGTNGMGIRPDTSTGDGFFLVAVHETLNLNRGYVSGSAFSGSLTYVGMTFAGLGIDTTPFSFDTLEGDNTIFFFTAPPQIARLAPTQATVEQRKVPTLFAVNTGAVMSAETTGLSSMASTLGGVQNAAQNAVGDLNNRIFNARSGGGGNGGGVASTLDRGTSRYLTFAQNQNIDYRVALGLADGEEVEIVDTLSGAGHPLAMVGVPTVSGSAIVAVEGGSGKNAVTDKVVIEDVVETKFKAFTGFDYGYYDQDNLTRNTRGFETDSYAGSAGLEYRVTDWLVAGAAFTYLNSDTNSSANLGSSDLEGNLLSGYATAFHGNTYVDFLYSYGDFNNDISRNTLLGRTAYGETESQTHNYRMSAGHTIDVTERFSFGPSAGLNYTTGEVDGYTERNGGLANLIYPDHEFESMIGRLGGYATYKMDTALGLLTTQFSAGWAHEFMPENGNVTASLETSPFALVTGNNVQSLGDYTASEERAHAGTDWLELGVTSRLDILSTDFHVELGYQGMLGRNNASGHFGSAKIGYEW